MKTLHYAGMSVMTGDRIAEHLLSSIPTSSSLARYAVVSFPARFADGPITTTQLVLSPFTQLLATTGESRTADASELDALELSADDFRWFPVEVGGQGAILPTPSTRTVDDYDYDYQELF